MENQKKILWWGLHMMKNKKRMVHVKVADGTVEQIRTLSIAMGEIHKSMPEYEFIVTNENVELRDVGQLIKELWKLHKAQKELKSSEAKNGR